MQSFYVDTCIYLNLWRKEVFGGEHLWKFALDFFKNAENNNSTIYYSGFILKEMLFILGEKEYLQKRFALEDAKNFKKIELTKDEFKLAQRIKEKSTDNLSFFDIIHLLLAKKTNSTLITRDNLILENAKEFSVNATKPEEVTIY